MAEPLESDLRLVLHDAIAHVDAALYKADRLHGSVIPGGDDGLYELTQGWVAALGDLLAEMRTAHDGLADSCDVCGCPKRSA